MNQQVFKDYTEREVEFLPIPLWYLDECNNCTVKLALDVEASPSDWIAIFKVILIKKITKLKFTQTFFL